MLLFICILLQYHEDDHHTTVLTEGIKPTSSLLHLESIRVLSVQVDHLVSETSLFHRLLEIRQRRQEHVVVTR